MAKTVFKIAAAALVMASALASTAQAKDFDVRYKKTELTSIEGATQIYHRIYDTAEDLCDYQFKNYPSSKTKARYNRCLRRTVKEFVGQIDHPNVDQAYAALPVRRIQDRVKQPVLLVKNLGG